MPEIKKYLNRDGLEEYNSLLPHSSAEMQTYVNEWLDEHPEATTTVQDGAITEPKLADKSVSLRTLADDTVHMLKGAILTGNLSGEVLTAADAYAAPPMALTVDGKSTQDGTPTPDAPVEIVSLEQVGLFVRSANLLDTVSFSDYSNWNTSRTYAAFTVSVPNGNVVVQYDGDVRHESGVYLNVHPGAVSQASGNFLIHPTTGIGASRRTLEVTTGCITFGLATKSAETLAYVVSSIGSTLRVTLDANEPYQPYVGTNVLLNLTQALRSLPDGTHDTLSFAYLRPSTREGWAWYTPTLTPRIGEITFNAFASVVDRPNINAKDFRPAPSAIASNAVYMSTSSGHANRMMCNSFVPTSDLTAVPSSEGYNNRCSYQQSTRYASFRLDADEYPDLETANAWLANNPITILLEYRDGYEPDPITLDPIELPILPAPECTVWSDPSTGLTMEYVRDANIVIQNIEQAIADQ